MPHPLAKRAAGESDDQIYDAELQREENGYAGTRCAIYFHGMGESRRKYNVMDQDAAWKMRVQVSRTHQKCLGGLLNE